ncbi:MAG TPA: hypothetical protein VI704_00130 [Bacteroidota bacterium]|nr:hypothetical protein [Bacteroidota bacterium]
MAKREQRASKRTKPHQHVTKEKDARRPEVIVDFVFDDGLFFISVKNIGDGPALKVSVTFDKRFRGVEGTQEISSLQLFRNIEFLAPRKEISTFLDTSASYFRRRQPTKITASISYRDQQKVRFATTISHDLSIYKQIGYIKKSGSRTLPAKADENRDQSQSEERRMYHGSNAR